MKNLVELFELDYEMVIEKLLVQKSSTQILALLNALKYLDHGEVSKYAV